MGSARSTYSVGFGRSRCPATGASLLAGSKMADGLVPCGSDLHIELLLFALFFALFFFVFPKEVCNGRYVGVVGSCAV